MTATNVYDMPGSDGDYGILDASGTMGHVRTGSGQPAWTLFVVGRLDSISPGADQCILQWKRQSNDVPNHGMFFDDGSNRLEYQYNAGGVFATATDSIAAATWYLWVLSFAGGTGNLTLRVIPLSTATQSSTASGGSGGSAFNDSQTQDVSFGGWESGGTILSEFAGELGLIGILKGTELGQAACEAIAADPINEIATLNQTYGTSFFSWDHTGVDAQVGSPSLQGGVTFGTGNGPDIAELSGTTGSIGIDSVGPGGLGIIYFGEQRVSVPGENLGDDTGECWLSNDSEGLANPTSMDIQSWADDEVIFNVLQGTLVSGSKWLHLKNKTAGEFFDLVASTEITVNADPGASQVVQRISAPPLNVEEGVAMTAFNASPYLYARHAQEVLTFGATGLPTGLSIDTATGEITGTPSAGTYNPSLSGTDENGAQATQQFQWGITTQVATTKSPGTWGRRRRT